MLEKVKWTYCEAYLWNPIWSLLKGVFKHGKLCKLKTVVSQKFHILRSIRAGTMLKGMPRVVRKTIKWMEMIPSTVIGPQSHIKFPQKILKSGCHKKFLLFFSLEKFLFWMVFHTQYCVKIIRLSHEQTPTSSGFSILSRVVNSKLRSRVIVSRVVKNSQNSKTKSVQCGRQYCDPAKKEDLIFEKCNREFGRQLQIIVLWMQFWILTWFSWAHEWYREMNYEVIAAFCC